MKRYLICLPLLFACCHLSHPLTQAQVLTIISDAGYGVAVGCDAGWLEPPVCAIAQRTLGDATLAVEQASNGWQAAAKAVLVSEESHLSPTSKIRPYLDAVIALL